MVLRISAQEERERGHTESEPVEARFEASRGEGVGRGCGASASGGWVAGLRVQRRSRCACSELRRRGEEGGRARGGERATCPWIRPGEAPARLVHLARSPASSRRTPSCTSTTRARTRTLKHATAPHRASSSRLGRILRLSSPHPRPLSPAPAYPAAIDWCGPSCSPYDLSSTS